MKLLFKDFKISGEAIRADFCTKKLKFSESLQTPYFLKNKINNRIRGREKAIFKIGQRKSRKS